MTPNQYVSTYELINRKAQSFNTTKIHHFVNSNRFMAPVHHNLSFLMVIFFYMYEEFDFKMNSMYLVNKVFFDPKKVILDQNDGMVKMCM